MLNIKGIYKIAFCAYLFLVSGLVLAQQSHKVFVKQGSVLILPDTMITVEQDTFIQVPVDVPYQVKDPSEIKSQSFYDSLGMQRRDKVLRNLIFKSLVVTSGSGVQDSIDFEQSESVFLPFAGKVIGRIRLKKVPVLAGSILDTL